jgi:hypothetical protein
MRSLICLEVICDGLPETVGGLIRLHSEVEDLISDRAVQPAADAEVRLAPLIGARIGRRSAVDVREKAELPAQRLKEGLPLGVVRRSELQLDGDVRLDVDGGIVCRHRIVGDVVEVGEGETDGGGVGGDTGHQQIESVEESDTLGKGDAGVVEMTHNQGDGCVLGSGGEEGRTAREGAAR